MTINFVDLFSGCGGLSYGFEKNSDFSQIIAVDNWAAALETLEINYKSSKVLHADISEPKIKSDLKKIVGSDCDVLIGGPPCQGFSTLGKREVGCKKSALVDDFIECALAFGPKIVLMENVKGFVSKKHSNNLTFSEHIRRRLSNKHNKHCYITDEFLVDCTKLGLAQTRTRYVFFGIRSDLLGCEEAQEAFRIFLYDSLRQPTKNLRDAIGDLPRVGCREGAPEIRMPNGRVIYNHQSMNHSRQLEKRFSYVPQGGGLLDVPRRLLTPHLKRMIDGNYGSGGHVKNIYGRLEWDKPAGTIVAGMDKITCGRFMHPDENRLLTPRECARLQGFPDNFRFLGGMVTQYYMIGNAVPPPLSTLLSNAALGSLEVLKKYSRKRRRAA